MACKEDTTLEALRTMMQCSICIDTFNDPRALPCAHVFCLKCLEKTQSKHKAQCALCRKPFDIPEGRLKELPKCTMIQDIIDLSKETKSVENSGAVEETVEKSESIEAPSGNIKSAGATLPTDALNCGNCNNCEHCSRAQDEHNSEVAHTTVALDDQTNERPTENTETPNPEDVESLCDVCILNSLDGHRKESTATLFCLDCNENQCEKCSAEHMRQRVCKSHTVVSLEDHLQKKLLQKEEPETNEDKPIFCDVCIANNENGTASIAIATMHCIDCTENQCEDCSREHKRQRLCKEHKIAVLDDQMKDKLRNQKEVARSANENIFCDICAENNETGAVNILATWHCTDCDENQCEDCSRQHKRQKMSKDHQVVLLDDQMKIKLKKLKEMVISADENIFCDICAENSESDNPKVVATWHCTDCNEAQCDDCNREHKRQRSLKSHQCVTLTDQLKEKLLEAKRMASLTEIRVFCDICKENNEIGKENIVATLYCTECKENQCEYCSKEHKKQRLFKNHQIVVLDTQMKEKLLNLKELDKKPDLEILCDSCAENSDVRETWSVATLHCIECDENQCSNCVKEHKKQSLYRNHEIIPIDDHLNSNTAKIKTEVDILCDMCAGDCANQTIDISKATHYCIDCDENQCEECNRSHLRQNQFREHMVITLSLQMQQKRKQTRTCSIHIKNLLKFYCNTCQQVICKKCVDTEHNSHEYQFACTVAEDFLNNINGYFEKVDLWLQQGEITKHELHTKYLDIENMYRVSRTCTNSDISEDPCLPKEHQLNTTVELKNELDEHLADVSAFKRRCSGLKTHKSSVNICLAMNEIRVKFEQLQRQQQLCSLEQLLPRGLSSVASSKPSYSVSLYYGFRQQMKELVEKELTSMLRDEAYSKIQKIIRKPRVKEDEINQFWRVAFPYIIQRIKMWNGYVITAQNIADLIIRKQKQKEALADSQTLAPATKKLKKTKTSEDMVFPVSRLDCLTYLINIADSIVAHDILWIMSKFPMAIPLIVQDIHEDDKYVVTVPIIQNIVIKWESSPGQIVENNLLTSPFRMVAAIRLGTNKIGKSTILNQLMSRHFMFSSNGEAGGRYGRPCTIDGAVEIVWLTQETCSNPTWKTTMSNYYKGNTTEVAILANLHGSALQHPDTLKYLEKHVCSFIVFLMPDFSEKELDHLKQHIQRRHILQVLVDPQENFDEERYMNTIRTDSLSSDDTLHTLRCLLRENLSFGRNRESASIEEICRSYESIKYAKPLHCKKSAEIVEIVRNHGCLNIKQLLCNANIKSHSEWNYNLKRLIKLSLEIISLQTRDAKKYLTYVETNLSQISANESMVARAAVSEANNELRRIVPAKAANGGNSEDKQTDANLKKAQEKQKTAMDKVDNTNLGQEHFFRTLGRLYEESLGVADLGDFAAVRNLPDYFADLLINGHAIEMLDGDSGNIQLIWIKAICDGVLKKLPKLKVFVISIIGLQSSGKSTLLNALFSCRFAVSVGRCSRGLFMRMIFLDNALKVAHGYDAIILIDTEGLSSPEKMNDPKANQKDRLMATYAMGISNLTIVNILGEGMTEMTEILQIAIVAMARLRGGGIKPDILMVQHLQERNVSKIDQAKGQFCEAINKAFDLISKNDVEIGLASAECLAELTARILSGDLFQHFGPFKDGSSVNSPPSESYHDDIVSLLDTILKRSAASENKSSFERWCDHFESYWICVQEENFALNFKNVKHITDFLYFEKKISKVRELLDRSLRSHREIFSMNIREQVSSQVVEKRKTETNPMHRQKLLQDIEQQLQRIPNSCPGNCDACRQFGESHFALLEELSNSEWIEDTKRSFETQKTRLRDITMNMLGQTFDGSLVRQGCFSEFSVIIANELNEALRKRPSGVYTPKEQERIFKNIWEYLQDYAAGMGAGPDLEQRLNQALHREYSGVLPTLLKDIQQEITLENLSHSRAIHSLLDMWRQGVIWDAHRRRLSEDQMNNLLCTINQLIESVFASRCVEFSKTGLDFEEGMVGDIRAAFPDTIKKFEDRLRMKLEGAFKMYLQIYALQHFKRKMVDLQKLWDSHNKPSEILQQKKQDYITEIETRLKSGFSSAGEGEVLATKLCSAIKKKAIQVGYDEKVQLIKNMSWTTNSEKVRLRYFEEMAKEVAAGRKERALRHFQNPKDEIQKWYKQRVDSFDAKEKVMHIYDLTLKTEFKRLIQKISNSTKEIEINRIVQQHIKASDDQYYSKLDPKDYDFEKFKESIERKLISFYEVDDREHIVFPLTSDDSEIMGRLGCTEHCVWCGALCWGSRGHQLDKDELPEMEKHHSCHQPSGLIGVRDRSSMKLRSRACHNRPDDVRVIFGDFAEDGDGILWSEAKRDHFKDWKFDVHCITTFDELMRWFFQELHRDIAKGRLALPADEKDLKEEKCKNLKLRDILNVVQNKI